MGNNSKNGQFGILLISVFFLLAFTRLFPYILHGHNGFGYDLGIYKSSFESITSLGDIIKSQIAIFPSTIAFIFNSLGIPIDYLLYHAHILFSILLAVPLYFLSKEIFNRETGLIAVLLFTLSYAQILGSEFYLYKAVLGGSIMLLGYLLYLKRSYWFYPCLILLALTQLPQFLILSIGVGITAIAQHEPEDYRYDITGLAILAGSLWLLIIFNPALLNNAIDVVFSAIRENPEAGYAFDGVFLSPEAYLHRGFGIIFFGIIGLFAALKNRKTTVLRTSILVMSAIVFFKLFFFNRYTFELDLLLIPFAAYGIIKLVKPLFKNKNYRFAITSLAIIGSIFIAGWYHQTTFPAVSEIDEWAINEISKKEDSEHVLVTNTKYAPYIHGFSNKNVLSLGMFESIWDIETHDKFRKSFPAVQASMLLELTDKYGKFYYFVDAKSISFPFDKISNRIIEDFNVSNVKIYELLPAPTEETPSQDLQ